ncbi:TetR/AcrR family transcriptional regulator [Nonomuraea pusilla]|uniref:TetR/AcrR family transcriptional regulator n=1 Tax=Nonomuraea pusilla TaxID=46177 RepID=UPI0006E1F558|nr:TetR/AcrR family transcriptional regulator C-terminal domain-containing protein [Nonomuraea pusilla]
MGRPQRPILSRERIFAEALRLIDEEGAEALTVTRLAARLGVQAASLYNHVAGRDEIVEGVRELVVMEIDIDALGRGPWREAIAVWARSYLAAFARHPNTIRLFATTTIRSPLTLAMYERAVVLLEEAGWPTDRVVAVFTAIESFTLGSALDLVAPTVMIDPAAQGDTVPRLAIALKGEHPDRAREAFELGLTALVAGLESLREGGG